MEANANHIKRGSQEQTYKDYIGERDLHGQIYHVDTSGSVKVKACVDCSGSGRIHLERWQVCRACFGSGHVYYSEE